jgi:maltooligosyltrehalose trehalohydrolase
MKSGGGTQSSAGRATPTCGRAAPEAARVKRRLPIGAELLDTGGAHFRVWAPDSETVAVEIAEDAREGDRPGASRPLENEGNGYFSGFVPMACEGALYKLRLAGGAFPDPASRFQPQGPHGASQIVDPNRFRWTDADWKGVPAKGQILYELHVGTFTPEGHWAGAREKLPDLAELGVTVLEIMPVADFPGRFGWGYDGVDLFAPTRLYGRPDDFRAFVDRAHQLGLGVILDVVYNHLGPDGNFLKEFSRDYFSNRHRNEWGEAINFDGKESGPVREFFLSNAAYWIDEFHLDGLRLDATQQIFDSSAEHILKALQRRVREAGSGRSTLIVAENETQEVKLVRSPAQEGYGLDMLWNDDFHHTALVAMTGRREAYYTDYRGSAQEFISSAKSGFLFQGQRYRWQGKRRGTPSLRVEPWRLVTFLENHDQVANSLRGARPHQVTSPGRWRALTALLLLGPGSPMLFQGQEFGSSSPFLYFADHHRELARLVAKGRKEFLSQFRTLACPKAEAMLAPPESEETFRRCKLDWRERLWHLPTYSFHRDLIKLRREDPVLSDPRPGSTDGAVLGPEAFVLRFFGKDNDDRLLLVNLGTDLPLEIAPEPLLAPVAGEHWQLVWSSEAVSYGGCGLLEVETEEGNWRISGQAAVLLTSAVNPASQDDGEDHPDNRHC